MILSDRDIREALESGRISVDPLGPNAVQPSSVDVRVDRTFRVFANHRHPYIDVRAEQPDLTEAVEVDGDEPFILHPGEFVLGSTYERVRLPDDLVARLEGKALATDTLIPTPGGWSTMGLLRVGDEVFDPLGRPTRVVAATGVMVGRPCYEIVFSDGNVIRADRDHRWWVSAKADREHGKRRTRSATTAEMAESLLVRGERNYQVPLAGPVAYPEKQLPIDPYVLGAWLGDGTSTAAEITCADREIVDEIARRGYRVDARPQLLKYRIGGVGHTRDAVTGRYARNKSLSSALRDNWLHGDKHVPDIYLQGSIEQRFDLLHGLMDTDGYVDTYGRCEFTTIKEHLAEAFVELASSLGFRPAMSKKRAMLNGVDCGPAFLVKFTPHRPVFRLRRKLRRQRLGGRSHSFRAVADIRPTVSLPVRCIQVASPTGVFLAGTGFIPTHNSSLGRLGLLIHSTAGFVDAGWDGWLTLELSNVANLPITIYPQMKIGQVAFFQLTGPAENPYGSDALRSKYKGQRGPTPSRFFENFDRPAG